MATTEKNFLKQAMGVRIIGKSRDAEADAADPQIKPAKTAPGIMAAHLAENEPIRIENRELKEELKEQAEKWSGALPTKLLDPQLIVRSKWANRHVLSFKDKEFEDLKADIKLKGQNVQPIKVRPIKGRPGMYEVVFGHRRHQACLELGIDVMAMIEYLDELNLFLEMDHENRQRKDLRPYEQGVMYAKALDDGLFSSMRKMAEEVGVEVGNMSKYISLARLPADVLAAFKSPLELQQTWATPLVKAIQNNPELVSARVKVLFQTTPHPSSIQVFNKLIESEGVVSNNTPNERQITSGKTLLATVKEGKKGATTVDISVALNAEDKKQLEALLSDFLKSRHTKG